MDSNKAAFGFDCMYEDDNAVVPDLSDFFSAENKAMRAAQDKAEGVKFQAEQDKHFAEFQARGWYALMTPESNEREIAALKATIERSKKDLAWHQGRVNSKAWDANDSVKAIATLQRDIDIAQQKITALSPEVEDYRDLAEIDAYERKYQ